MRHVPILLGVMLLTTKVNCQDFKKTEIIRSSIKKIEGRERDELRLVREYDKNGNLLNHEDIKLNFGITQVTKYEYKDTLLTKRIWRHSNIKEESNWGYEYDSRGCLTGIFSKSGDMQVFTYENNNNCQKLIETGYDDKGNVRSVIKYEYDQFGHQIKSTIDQKRFTISKVATDKYNSQGLNISGEIIQNGTDTTLRYQNVYDAKQNLIEKKYWDSRKQEYGTKMQYNEDNKLVKEEHTNVLGQLVWVRTYEYYDDGLMKSFHEKYFRNTDRDIEIVLKYERWK